MSRIRQCLLLTTLLLPFAATAQPGPVRTEHDWTLHIGGKCYGVYQAELIGDKKYGAGRYTTVYAGTPLCTVRMRAGGLIALLLAPLGAVGAGLLMRRETKNGG
jgi:hypothetical protein